MQVARDVYPRLDEKGIKLRCISIGDLETGQKWCAHIGFPPELLLCDPEAKAYEVMGFEKGVEETFFKWSTPWSILKRMPVDRAFDLINATVNWQPWLPPKADQSLQQGGAFVWVGDTLRFTHFDESTGDHVDLVDLLQAAILL